jgi:hypothetical protein
MVEGKTSRLLPCRQNPLAGILPIASRLDKSVEGLAESLKVDAAAADLMMRQRTGALPWRRCFQPDSFLDTTRLYKSTQQS